MKNNWSSVAAQTISVIWHPLFFYFFMVLLLTWMAPDLFVEFGREDFVKFLILNGVYTVLFPALGIFLLYKLNFIESLEMEDSQERIGPFIVTAVFYSWTFINLRNTAFLPDIILLSLLGVLISLYLGFFINLFDKISIHAMAVGGMLAFSWLLLGHDLVESPVLSLGFTYLQFHAGFVFILSVLLVGLVCWARLQLKKHSMQQVAAGLMMGVFGFFVAAQFYP
ncbi:MAG TPA: hypothetical protein VJ917_02670 [Saprospiraceae bacterium]|nr:hypothetical protein [Saprospiraceae bacterium]